MILIDGIGEGTLKDIVAHMKGKKSSSTKKSSSRLDEEVAPIRPRHSN
ncbi:MAG: hypothetical protein R3F11_27010 [Verrucomicrobiales bacterium]